MKTILCYKYKRILNKDGTISYKNRCLQLDKKQKAKLYSKDKIDVYVAFDGTVSLWKNNIKLNFKEVEKVVKQKPKAIEKIDKRSYSKKPKHNHSWVVEGRKNFEQLEDISNESKTGHF